MSIFKTPKKAQNLQPLAILEHIRDLGVPRKATPGKILLSEGDPIEGFYWLEEGAVRVFQINLEGKEFEVARFGAGQWVAPALALSADRFPHFMMSLTNSRLLFFSREKAIERIVQDPLLARHFLQLLADRCQFLHKRLHTLQLQSLRDRLEHYLLQECAHDGKCLVRIAMPKKDLAQVLGTTPETLSRTLRQMEEEGVIDMKGREIRMLQCGRNC